MDAGKEGESFPSLTNPALAWIVIALCLATLINITVEMLYPNAVATMIDFDAFYIAGQFIHDGKATEAYDPAAMRAAQTAFGATDVFLPWTYPPPYDLLVSALPLAPRGIAYFISVGMTFAAFMLILRRLAGTGLGAVLIATFPAIYLQTLVGQNGFMTGALVGLFCLLSLRGRATAGIPLGLMIIKPHLGLGLGLMVLAQRRWRVILVAATCAGLACMLSTLVFGTEIWAAFFGSLREASARLYEKRHVLHRMASVYACLASFGLSPALSMKLHSGVALAASVAIVWVALQGWTARRVLGCAVLLSLLISPYLYVYDLTLLAVGLALLMPDLMRHASRAEMWGLMLAAWLTCGWGLFLSMLWPRLTGEANAVSTANDQNWSLAAVGYLTLLGIVAVVLRRAVRRDDASGTRAQGPNPAAA